MACLVVRNAGSMSLSNLARMAFISLRPRVCGRFPIVPKTTNLLLFGQFKNPSENIQAHNKLEGGTNGEESVTLGGGGPAAGLHIGVLEALATAGITFDVWHCPASALGLGSFIINSMAKKLEIKIGPNRPINFSRMACFETMKAMNAFP